MWLLLLHLFLVLNFIWRFSGPWLCWQPVKWIDEVQQVGLIASCAVLCLVAQSCPTLCDPMDCSLQGSSVHGIFQARILEWVAMPSSRGSSQPRDWTSISCTGGRILYPWAAWEAQKVQYRLKSRRSTSASPGGPLKLQVLKPRPGPKESETQGGAQEPVLEQTFQVTLMHVKTENQG